MDWIYSYGRTVWWIRRATVYAYSPEGKEVKICGKHLTRYAFGNPAACPCLQEAHGRKFPPGELRRNAGREIRAGRLRNDPGTIPRESDWRSTPGARDARCSSARPFLPGNG